jgi:hypothetical protein
MKAMETKTKAKAKATATATATKAASRRHLLGLTATTVAALVCPAAWTQTRPEPPAPSDPPATATSPRPAAAPAPAPVPGDPATAASRSILVLEFELVDDHDNPLTKAAQEIRLRNAGVQLRRELAERQLYRVADPEPTLPLQRELRRQQEFLYRCDDCAAQAGRVAGADLVMQTWVQKVSELILNLNVQIYDVAAGRVVFTKSVDMRGNDDVSWNRAVRFLVRDMAEKRERNPRYGL